MPIWAVPVTVEELNAGSANCMVSHIGIEFVEIGPDSLTARMPVDARTVQPMGILHGGASAALAETLGSVAATLCIDARLKLAVGLEINANHIRPVRPGTTVTGVAGPIHLGGSTQVWEIRITNEQDRLVCISRLTLAVLDRS
jgi:1,4-dihydroxy-2-naphthoyl-CoA hydrolase